MNYSEARHTLFSITETLNQEEDPTPAQETEMAINIITLVGELLIDAAESLRMIANKR